MATVVTDFEPGVRRIVREVRTELAVAFPALSVWNDTQAAIRAAARARTVTIHITVGDPEPGYWCDTCLLPSAVQFPLHGLYRYGIIDLGRMWACPDCGHIQRRR